MQENYLPYIPIYDENKTFKNMGIKGHFLNK